MKRRIALGGLLIVLLVAILLAAWFGLLEIPGITPSASVSLSALMPSIRRAGPNPAGALSAGAGDQGWGACNQVGTWRGPQEPWAESARGRPVRQRAGKPRDQIQSSSGILTVRLSGGHTTGNQSVRIRSPGRRPIPILG